MPIHDGAGRLEVLSPRGSHTLAPAADQLCQPLTDLLRRANLPLNTRCGQRGLCDGCLIELIEGQLVQIRTAEVLRGGGPPRLVRGCEYRLDPGAHASIRIPERSALGYEPRIVSDFRLNVSCSREPLWLPKEMARPLGAAVDIGTTTVVVLLVDLSSGEVVARTAAFNEQMHLGDDVLTRITLCRTDPSMLGQLQQAVADRTIGSLLDAALKQAGASPQDLACICFAGNTTMLHLLIGEDPGSMGVAPFTPAFVEHRIVQPSVIFGNGTAIQAQCHLLPSAAAYVGADLTAGVLASGLAYDDGPSLLVDVGTNGEIILKHGEKLIGCATAAGPAFEGAGLSSGMRAGDGAISHFRVEHDFSVVTELIGEHDVRPVGICGSAYIDFLAEGRRVGLLNEAGRFDPQCPPPLRRRVSRIDHSNDLAFIAAHAGGRKPIAITQKDLASLLQAKAAIAAGILTLLDRAGMTPADVKTVYLAGGFGTHMDSSHAIAAGLLPGFRPAQVQPVGNTSLGGAYLALMDRGVLDEIARVAKQMDIVELNLEPQFESHYIDQLSLP